MTAGPWRAVEVPVIRCPACDVPWVLRWSIHLGGRPPEFVYQRDCRHKSKPTPPSSSAELEHASIAMARDVKR